MGSAIGRFEKTRVLIVPRLRFAPVKSNADLLVRRSDAYVLLEDHRLVRNPERSAGEPEVVLDDAYKKIDDFQRLFQAIPSLLHLEKLEIQGAVRFDAHVALEGRVTLRNKNANPVNISTLNLKVIRDQEIEF
jgi:UTP--glucose-1-phosphate uridylyltransferase